MGSVPGLRRGLNILCLRSPKWMGEQSGANSVVYLKIYFDFVLRRPYGPLHPLKKGQWPIIYFVIIIEMRI